MAPSPRLGIVVCESEGQLRLYAASYAANYAARMTDLRAFSFQRPFIVTSDSGTGKQFPVAATDSQGKAACGVAWQAFRGDNLDILARRPCRKAIVSSKRPPFPSPPRSDWDPSIAAAPNGEVAVSWDTYHKGDYDVYFRRVRADLSSAPRIGMDAPVAVAASNNFEARSSVVYRFPKNRLCGWRARSFRRRSGAKITAHIRLPASRFIKVTISR